MRHPAKRLAGVHHCRLCWSAGHLTTETSAAKTRPHVGMLGYNLTACFRCISCMSMSESPEYSPEIARKFLLKLECQCLGILRLSWRMSSNVWGLPD